MTEHHHGSADSAGQPWAGRQFEPNPAAGDDGSAPEALIEAISRFRSGDTGEADVVDAVRDARLLIPLVAVLGESATGDHGLTVDKSQELSIVTVAGPDGRVVLPVFSSVAAMARWNPSARPVPATGVRVALAAASEQTDIVVLDAANDTEFAIRRPALWAIARQLPWTPSYLDGDVLNAFMDAAAPESAVVAVQLAPGDPQARLAAPELLVHLSLVGGLERKALDTLVARLQERWAASEVIASRVDSLAVTLVPAT